MPSFKSVERVAGIEPASSAWKAEVLPLNYTRQARRYRSISVVPRSYSPLASGLLPPAFFPLSALARWTPDLMVEGEGFEPSKAKPSDLQSDPFDHSGTPPRQTRNCDLAAAPSQRPARVISCNSKHLDLLSTHLFRSRFRRSLLAEGTWCRQEESNSRPSHYK